MFSVRTLFVLLFLVVADRVALATGFEPGARSESSADLLVSGPSVQAKHARQATLALQDKLRLTTAQVLAFQACTQHELQALTLADSPSDIARAQRRHMLAAGRILNAWQFQQYLELRQELVEQQLFVNTEELARR
ncbi:hypothetical protein GCM10023185_09240 [Hymenobacter saemangeumensis]|uniref:Periplasmic heavy metal sensor n=1 Tax=Hymenobacter saemangeumensis TaxID=1084522 RepID=A0ABP8I417_9BACT